LTHAGQYGSLPGIKLRIILYFVIPGLYYLS
jgi:hypothetical protein